MGEVRRGERRGRPVADVQQVLVAGVADHLAKAPERGQDRADGANRMAPDSAAPGALWRVDRVVRSMMIATGSAARTPKKIAVGTISSVVAFAGSERDGAGDQPDEPADDRRQSAAPASDVHPENPAGEDADGPDPERQDDEIADPEFDSDVGTGGECDDRQAHGPGSGDPVACHE